MTLTLNAMTTRARSGQGMWRWQAWLGFALLVTLSGCFVDRGYPPLEEQMQDLGLSIDSMMIVDEDIKVTVHLQDGKPELIIFTPFRFGGWEPKRWPTDIPTVNGGAAGDGFSSTSPAADEDVQRYQIIFGAGQGPVAEVRTDTPQARSKIVNAEIGGWVLVVPNWTEEVVAWELIGPDGTVVYSGIGLEL